MPGEFGMNSGSNGPRRGRIVIVGEKIRQEEATNRGLHSCEVNTPPLCLQANFSVAGAEHP